MTLKRREMLAATAGTMVGLARGGFAVSPERALAAAAVAAADGELVYVGRDPVRIKSDLL